MEKVQSVIQVKKNYAVHITKKTLESISAKEGDFLQLILWKIPQDSDPEDES